MDRAYVYICTRLPHLDYSKVGFTKRLWPRLKQLETNSASPFKWSPWRAFQLETGELARRLESLVKLHSALRSSRVDGKAEFFQCRPSQISDAIEDVADKHQIELLRNLPVYWETVQELADNCLSLPTEVLALLPREARYAYWIGARDSLRALSFLHSMVIEDAEFLDVVRSLGCREMQNDSEAWKTIVGYFLNSRNVQTRRLAQAALPNAAAYQRSGREYWQDSD